MALRTLQADLKDFRAYDAKHPKTDFRSWMQMKADGFDTRSGWRLADTCYAHGIVLNGSLHRLVQRRFLLRVQTTTLDPVLENAWTLLGYPTINKSRLRRSGKRIAQTSTSSWIHQGCTSLDFTPQRQPLRTTAEHGQRSIMYTRRARLPKYDLIEFGLSRRYDPEDGIPAETPIEGADHTVPEFKGDGATRLANLYPTDVYYLGNFVKERFKFTNFEFTDGLVKDMTQHDPARRPTIDEVVNRFGGVIRSLSFVKLHSPLIEPGTHGF
ncbi:hypothetical protein M422DRAFT_250150 [Sphaerobolus stellatus SS14]|nr:hypothetical protein M422DRAFT_250150 [Sphaerobolus stellatus SS14]